MDPKKTAKPKQEEEGNWKPSGAMFFKLQAGENGDERDGAEDEQARIKAQMGEVTERVDSMSKAYTLLEGGLCGNDALVAGLKARIDADEDTLKGLRAELRSNKPAKIKTSLAQKDLV